MRIFELDRQPLHRLRFLNAAPRGGVVSEVLPIVRGRVDALPDGLDALVLTSDLQGVVRSTSGELVLLGIALAEELVRLSDDRAIPDPSATGVVLAGDLYSAPGGDVRGASGDVRDVWLAFRETHRWVVGVAGNHDRFGSEREQRGFEAEDGVHLLDGSIVELDTIRFGGVGLIIGNPDKPGRRASGDFLDTLELVLGEGPRVMVLHEGPSGDAGQRGNADIRELVEQSDAALTVCGHCHWDDPVAELAPGRQVLNVDGRAVVLTR